MKNERNLGFTLIELMIVVEIISIVAAISIPSLIRTRIRGNETAAVGNLKTFATAEVMFHNSNSRFGTLEELCEGDITAYVQGEWSNGCVRFQYVYTYDAAAITDSAFRFEATPLSPGRTGIRTYWIDETGEIGFSEAAAP